MAGSSSADHVLEVGVHDNNKSGEFDERQAQVLGPLKACHRLGRTFLSSILAILVGGALLTPRSAGSSTQIRQDGQSATYYADSNHLEIVGFERWGCSGAHFFEGVRTDYEIGAIWSCDFGNPGCPTCPDTDCTMDGYNIDCNYLCILGSNYMYSCGSGAYIGCQVDNTCP